MNKEENKSIKRSLTLTPEYETTLEKEGFIGALYRPKENLYPGKVLIMAGAADGSYNFVKQISELYVKSGLTVLALATWNVPGLPPKLSHIPLEFGEISALWLKKQGFSQIGIAGISQGAVFALLCASLFNDLINCVVAFSPMSVCGQGIRKKNDKIKKDGLCSGSAYSYRGKDYPFVQLNYNKPTIVCDCMLKHELCLRSIYDDVWENAPEETKIPVEFISGPVMLLASDNDSFWPSKEAAESMVNRLKAHNFPHPVIYEHFCYASHYILPFPMYRQKYFRVQREHPKECRDTNQYAFETSLSFLKDTWK